MDFSIESMTTHATSFAVCSTHAAILSLVQDGTLLAIGDDRNSPGPEGTVENASELTQM